MTAWPAVDAIIGMASAARDRFFDGLTTDDTSTGPMVHVQIADALSMIDEAKWHADQLASRVDTRAALTAICRLACDATYVLGVISGPATEPGPAAIRRIARDLEVAADRVLRDFDLSVVPAPSTQRKEKAS